MVQSLLHPLIHTSSTSASRWLHRARNVRVVLVNLRDQSDLEHQQPEHSSGSGNNNSRAQPARPSMSAGQQHQQHMEEIELDEEDDDLRMRDMYAHCTRAFMIEPY